MKLIGRTKEKEVWFSSSNAPYNFQNPFDGEEYVCLIFNNDKEISTDDQKKLSKQIVMSGCRYAVCAGHDCSSWDDSIDYAYLETDENYNPPDSTFVMTSWHEDESVEEILNYAIHTTNFAENRFSKLLIFFVKENQMLERNILKEIKNIC